jgi:tetratricopeptide (TPR) repeat protein
MPRNPVPLRAVLPSVLLPLLLVLPPLAAQGDPLAGGIAAMERWDLPAARTLLTEAVRRDPGSYEANWRLAHVLVDIGKVVPDSIADPARDSLYVLAESYARRAVAANPDQADGHFVLANAIGRVSLTKSKRERVDRAVEIRNEALKALGLDPEHAGAYHVLGRWHAEIQRLSSVQRFFARNFLGASIFDQATWDSAERYLRLAVQYDPDRIFHHLDLGEVYLDREKWAEARAEFEAVARLPVFEPMDVTYKRDAARRLAEIAERRGP